MLDRTALARLGKLVAADVAAGRPGPSSQEVSRQLEMEPEVVLDLTDMLVAEAGKKRPNQKLVTAYAYMIGQALEYARYGIEGGRSASAELVEAARHRLLAMGKDGRVEPALLLMVLREFARAKLDPGPDLRRLMERLTQTQANSGATTEASMPSADPLGALNAHLEELSRQVGGDTFEFYALVQEMAGAFPDDHRAAMGAWLLQSREPTAREAALGWLLDTSASVRNSTASGIEQAAAAGGLSGIMLRRLIALRNWLPEPDRMSVDRAIQVCRRKGVEISSPPQAQVRDVLASGIDGAGAQSIFILVREGRRNAVACVLLKHGIGVRDAWARHSLTRSELGDFMAQTREIELFPISLDYVRIAMAHALVVNLASGVMAPFALLDVIETAGLQGIQPEEVSADGILDRLEAAADLALTGSDVVAQLLARSRRLPDELGFLDSWFEADTEAEQLLGGRKLSRPQRISLVQNELLPPHIPAWVERLAWTALTLQNGENDEPWEEFFVSARELKAGRPVGEIPLMAHVAVLTVEAYAARHPERRNHPGSQRRKTASPRRA